MSDKFILKAHKHNKQIIDGGSVRVRVSPEAYELLSEMAFDSGKPMSKIASMAILFAYDNLEYEYDGE